LEQQSQLAFSENDDHKIETYRGLAFKSFKKSKEEVEQQDISSFGDYLDNIYEQDGTMEKEISNYEKRSGQREMSEHIYDAFQVKKHALIEAETGTGKSLAYLIPAIYEAVHNKERIIISTYTTQLQSQLLDEEIPMVRKLIHFPFKVALLKGKSHYISLERFERELTAGYQDNYDIALTKAMLLVWLTETTTGDIDEIQLPSSGYYFFKKISTDSEGYIDPHSSWFSRSYYQEARTKAQHADILITNHALFSTDMFNDYKFLPSYNKAVIDEAHHLETTASRHYGLKLDYVTMQYILNQLGLTYESNWLGKTLLNHQEARDEFPINKWDEIFGQAKYEIDDLFRTIYQYVIDQNKNNKSLSDIGRIQYRFEEKKESLHKWNIIKEMATRLTFFLRDLIHMLTLLDQYFEQQGISTKNDRDDLKGNIQSLQTFIDHIEQLFLIEDSIEQVKWIEAEAYGAKNAVYLYSEPADISTLLTKELFNKKQSIILTSATLTMRDSFSFIQKRLGLTSDHVYMHKIKSPFSYQDQVQLLIPDDFPDINSNLDEFIYSTCEAILSLAKVTKGRMLVLFTSYEMLRKSHHILKETMDLDEYMLISQGISSGSRTRLKKNFQTFDQAILLGTSSFWEGVDIPGDDLSCLMIVRLPFQPPNHPVYEAKSIDLKELGKSAFFELALPDAVIRFKQGFGRLIRSTNDRGIVFVCDARIVKARYGKFFTKSIPQVPITYDSTYKLINKAEEWF
jgi:ATP-dependent DNA helicase DinG